MADLIQIVRALRDPEGATNRLLNAWADTPMLAGRAAGGGWFV
jgi:hypothetical protein